MICMKQCNSFYRFINREVKAKCTRRNMSLSAVKAEYMNYLKDKPREELRNELMEIQHRADYSDDSSINMVRLLMGLVTFLVSITALVVGNNRVSAAEIMYLIMLFIFIYLILLTMGASINIVKSVSSRKNHDRNQFEHFKRECIEEVLGSTASVLRVPVRKISHKHGA